METAIVQNGNNSLERVTGAHAVITTDHAFIHGGIAYTLAGKMDVASAQTGAIQLVIPGNVAASLTSNMTAATADLTYTAVTAGSEGNYINVTHVDPGAANQALSVSVNVKTITVSLATNGAAAITSTAAQVKAAVNANAAAAALVTCEDEGAGSGVVNALANANLAGGTDAVYCHLKPAALACTGGPVTVTLREDSSFAAAGTAATPRNRKRIGTPDNSKLTCKTIANATIVAGGAAVTLDTTVLPGTSSGAKLGSSSQAAEEWVLKPGGTYLVALANETSPGATVTVGYELFWYEETGA